MTSKTMVIPNGADLLVETLRGKGVEFIFCISGAGNLAIIDAIVREGSIRLVYSHHEQAAVMEAQGYSRVSGKTGVALVTTGGGASNSLTGVLSAYLDSISTVIISGNESSFHCENTSKLRAYGVQGFDAVEVMRSVTKFAVRINSASEVVRDLNRAWNTAGQDRKGPVLLDFPMDLQRKLVKKEEVVEKTVSESLPNVPFKDAIKREVQLFKSALGEASKPLIYVGNGCRGKDEQIALIEFLKSNQLPYCLSWSAADLLSSEDEFNVGRIGIYGDRAANIALQKADLLLCIGNRLAIPQIGYDMPDFGRNATKWIIEIDPTECAKFMDTDWKVLNTSAIDFLQSINREKVTFDISVRKFWLDELKKLWKELPRMSQIGSIQDDESGTIHSALVIDFLNRHLHDDAIVVTDVGAGLLTGHYIFAPRAKQRFFTSQGLGEMGFGLPGAIGASFAAPHQQLVCLNTDGGIMFNLQELQLIKEHKIPIKLFIFNNDGYAMIKISQQNLFAGRVSGSGTDSGISFPSFDSIAKTFGLEYIEVRSKKDLDSKLKSSLESPYSVLIEVIMSPTQKYLPRLATSKLDDGSLISPPIEDLDPLLPIEDLERFLGYRAHHNSYIARGIPYAE
jgi:acetolactate synthase-1/2/3 large subunit